MRIINSILLSLAIDFGLMLVAAATLENWLWIWFFIAGMWPIIWMMVIILPIKNPPRVDMIKMQNYFNTDAIRRNTDRMIK